MSTKAIPYVLKKNAVIVTLKSKTYTLNSSHPTFPRLTAALKKKDWANVPALVSLADEITAASKGALAVTDNSVYYKGERVTSSIAERIVDMSREGKPMAHLLRFLTKLYQNPSKEAIQEFYGWLERNHLPITDDGCFLAYKAVNDNYRDTHTNTVDNRPGQVISMPRKDADLSYRTACSYGFHVCSKQYGIYGTKVMAVKVNPKDVIAAPEGGKMRVLRYEVLTELGSKGADFSEDMFKQQGIASLEKKLVIEVSKERKELIRILRASPGIKKAIRQKKISVKTLIKASYARLKSMAQKYDAVPKLGPEVPYHLKAAREAHKLTIGQLAKQMGKTYKAIVALEKNLEPSSQEESDYLSAIAALTGINAKRSAISYPKTVAFAQ